MQQTQLVRKAFTLAETLVVIGIIGVIASLTLPNLNNSTNNKETVAKLQKVYAELNNAHGQAVIKYGPVVSWYNGTDDNALMTRITCQRM